MKYKQKVLEKQQKIKRISLFFAEIRKLVLKKKKGIIEEAESHWSGMTCQSEASICRHFKVFIKENLTPSRNPSQNINYHDIK